MTDIYALKDAINKSGYKLTYIAERVGLTYQGLKNKIDGKNEFTTSEVKAMCDVLAINSLKERERIFFAN